MCAASRIRAINGIIEGVGVALYNAFMGPPGVTAGAQTTIGGKCTLSNQEGVKP